MSASMHPTIDQIADHAAGLSSADDGRWIAEHLTSCQACSETVGRLSEVVDLLGAVGAQAEPMPADVADRLDSAVTQAAVERKTGVSSLSERRAAGAGDTGAGAKQAPSRRGRFVLGAAAAVAVFAIGGAVVSNGLPGTGGGDDSAQDSAASGQTFAPGGSAEGSAPQAGGHAGATNDKHADSPQRRPDLDQTNVDAFARELSDGKVQGVITSSPAGCDVGRPASGDSTAPSPPTMDALVSYQGRRAVLRLERKTRQLTVFACPGPARVLYRSSY